MQVATHDELRSDFEAVAATVGSALSAGNRHVVALVAKWEKRDLVPGLSDLDFRVICDDDTTIDDWVAVDRLTGRVHLEMVREHPRWNRINEHTAGAGVTVGELLDGRCQHPEFATWSLWWGRSDWLRQLKAQLAAGEFGAADERYHLGKFLHYYSPYIHGIDPPINLGSFEAKYPLHSRCWHYLAPPVLSAAAILARRNFCGKWEGLSWLRDHGYVTEQVDAVLHQVSAHYETPELVEAERLRAFEQLLFSAFEQLLPRLIEAIEYLDIDRAAGPAELKQRLAAHEPDPRGALIESLRYARIRAGRYYFYANAPDHFDASRLVYYELPWIQKLSDPVFANLGRLLGAEARTPEQCLDRLGLETSQLERRALGHVRDLAHRSRDDAAVPGLFRQAIDLFPHYYRLLARALNLVVGLSLGMIVAWVAMAAMAAPPAPPAQGAAAGNAVNDSGSRIRENSGGTVNGPNSHEFGYGQNSVSSSRKNRSRRCAAGIHYHRTAAGNRFGTWSSRPVERPAPTLFIFAGTIEQTLADRYYRQCGNALAEAGYLCVSLDLPCHGHARRQDEPAGLDGWSHRTVRGDRFVDDFNVRLRDVLDYLIAQRYTDPERIAACGTSRGGFIALHFAASDRRVKCVAAFAPVTDLAVLREFQGLGGNALVQSLDLTRHAESLAGRAVWLVIGDRDQRVGSDSTIALARSISRASIDRGVPSRVELHVLPEPRGHTTPAGASAQAAVWIAAQLKPANPDTRFYRLHGQQGQ